MPNKLGASLRRNIMPTIKFDDFLKEQLKDPKFKARFEKESANLESAIVIAKAREAAGLTQRDLAEKSGVPQSTIARIEQGANTSISIKQTPYKLVNVAYRGCIFSCRVRFTYYIIASSRPNLPFMYSP